MINVIHCKSDRFDLRSSGLSINVCAGIIKSVKDRIKIFSQEKISGFCINEYFL